MGLVDVLAECCIKWFDRPTWSHVVVRVFIFPVSLVSYLFFYSVYSFLFFLKSLVSLVFLFLYLLLLLFCSASSSFFLSFFFFLSFAFFLYCVFFSSFSLSVLLYSVLCFSFLQEDGRKGEEEGGERRGEVFFFFWGGVFFLTWATYFSSPSFKQEQTMSLFLLVCRFLGHSWLSSSVYKGLKAEGLQALKLSDNA